MPSANNVNNLNCQTILKARFDPQRVFATLSNLIIERDDGRYRIGLRGDTPATPHLKAAAGKCAAASDQLRRASFISGISSSGGDQL
jgi:hypothetical protein